MAKVLLAEHDDVVDALSSDRSDEPFRVPICQGDGAEIGGSRAHRSKAPNEGTTIRAMVKIAQRAIS